MPHADPAVRKAYHKAYAEKWFKAKPREYMKSPARKAAQVKWAAKNPDHSKTYYAANRRRFQDRNLRKLYGISVEQYEAMLRAQDGRCAICEKDKPGGKRRMPVDHCHATGRVRGLLCVECNSGLGRIEGWYAKHRAKIDAYIGAAT